MKKALIILAISGAIIAFALIRPGAHKPDDPRGSAYAGSASCARCHRSVYLSYVHTAHYQASAPATARTVHGSFNTDSNRVVISPSQNVVMERVGTNMFQSWYVKGKVAEHRRFDIVMGGIKGESYLYWNSNGLNQLPVSYYTEHKNWLLSPGFAPGTADFSRIITSRCLECHASFVADQPAEAQRLHAAEQFEKSTLVYHIDCERCHGPGAEHVQFQTNHPQVKTAKFIASYASLPRERKIDLCAVCHSGNKSQMIRSTFFYVPGDTLARFKLPDFQHTAADTTLPDVHGNQVQLLQSSKCFIYSKMDCATCHDTHRNQRGDNSLYIQKCLSCHNAANHNYCKMANASNALLIKANCIRCHMPNVLTKKIISPTFTKTPLADILVRTHHIAIYPRQANNE